MQPSRIFIINLVIAITLFFGYFLSRANLHALAAFIPSTALIIYYHYLIFNYPIEKSIAAMKVLINLFVEHLFVKC